VEIRDLDAFVTMVRTMFTQRRKTLGNALKPFGEQRQVQPVQALTASGIDPKRRPETLNMAELAALSHSFAVLSLR
jgi:16S rRNA (adenine1518-N6/adenine1519-N6)-dimethyltransferase